MATRAAVETEEPDVAGASLPRTAPARAAHNCTSMLVQSEAPRVRWARGAHLQKHGASSFILGQMIRHKWKPTTAAGVGWITTVPGEILQKLRFELAS